MNESVRIAAKRIIPAPVRLWLRTQQRKFGVWPPLGMGRLGSLRRVSPISSTMGLDRGQGIDRYYIENFLAGHRPDIRGRVLEIANNSYTTRFGAGQVTRSDVLHVHEGNPRATMVANLESDEMPADLFDCIILTQTLPFIYDTRAALRNLHRMLKPRGVLLATFPGISQISRYDMQRWGDYWRFTSLSARRLFEESFPAANVAIETHGNVLVACASLYGMASQELRKEELAHLDPDYEFLITVRAVK